MKKIALMVFSSVISGAESVVIHMLKNIDKAEFDIYLISNDEIIEKINIEGVKKFSVGKLYSNPFIIRLARKIIGNRLLIKVRLQGAIKKVNKYIQEQNIQIVHSNLLLDHYVNSKLTLPGIKRVMTIHGSHDLDREERMIFKKVEIKSIYESTDLVCSACEYFLLLLHGIKADIKSIIIPNGIDSELLEQKRVPEIKDGNLNIVFLGGTREVKGGDILLEALDIVINEQKRKNIHLDILRDVPSNSYIYQYAEKHDLLNYITFSGYVDNNEHLKHMSASNLYVLPSYSEGIANTLTEAIGYGKPILATNVGGTPELVKHMKNGYLCDTTAKSIGDGILFFLDHNDKLTEFSRVNVSLIESLQWKNIIKQYENEYRKVID